MNFDLNFTGDFLCLLVGWFNQFSKVRKHLVIVVFLQTKLLKGTLKVDETKQPEDAVK